jgi:hypothetical protein
MLVPVALSGFIGIVGSNALYQSHRAVSWAVNQAVMVNGLRQTPTTTSVGNQRWFRVTFIPDANGGTYSWSLNNPIPGESCGVDIDDNHGTVHQCVTWCLEFKSSRFGGDV